MQSYIQDDCNLTSISFGYQIGRIGFRGQGAEPRLIQIVCPEVNKFPILLCIHSASKRLFIKVTQRDLHIIGPLFRV